MLTGKTALITGSTSGIGLGIAQALAAQGVNILLNGFCDVEAARALLAKNDVQIAYHDADMRSAQAIAAMMIFAKKTFGKVDILINNAGIQYTANIEDFPIERWDEILSINLSSAFHTTRLALPDMQKNNWGRIINIASVHGLVASVQKSAYVAAKHGLLGLTKVTALENAQTAITCNAICPGWVLTPLVQAQIDARAAKEKTSQDAAKQMLLSEKQPSKEFVTIEQIGQLAVFLCSEAANQMRGAAINIDGGWISQ